MRKKLLLVLALTLITGCKATKDVSRDHFEGLLTDICRSNYQARVVPKAAGDTIWVYLPYMPGRKGIAESKDNGKELYLEYSIASLNPYRIREPAELKFLVQKILGEIRGLFLRSNNPYAFFVLVITDITSPKNPTEEWYIGYGDDVKNHSVGRDFSGEGYNRLTWCQEDVSFDQEGISRSYRDAAGDHVPYHDITMKEFVERQIKWRIYKRFTIEYNRTPFDVTAQEKLDEIANIIQAVLTAYHFEEFEAFDLRDSSFLDESKVLKRFAREDILKRRSGGITRRPAF